MKLKNEYIFNFSKDFLLDQYSSQAFYEARMEMDEIENANISSFTQKGSITSFEIDRVVEIHTHKAPKFIQKIADSLISDNVHIVTQVLWDKKRSRGHNHIKPQSVPISVEIIFNLEEISDTETRVKTDLEINAKIPIVGKRLEKFILPKAEKVLLKDFEKAVEYFETI
jgi:hypothetical protein